MDIVLSKLLNLAEELMLIKNKDELIAKLIDGLNVIFWGKLFSWNPKSGLNNTIDICTEDNCFGSIEFDKSIDNNMLELVQGLVQMLAILLENIQYNKLLGKENIVDDVVILPELIEKKQEIFSLKSELKLARQKHIMVQRALAQRIFDLEEAKEKVEESETKFKGLVETTSDWIWEIDIEGNFIYVSPRIKELLGYNPEELLGKNAFGLMDKEEAERVEEVYAEYVKGKKAFCGMINVNVHKDGHKVIVESSALPILGKNGNLIGYRGIDRDITDRKKVLVELKESKEQAEKINANIKAIIENTDNSIWSINRNYELTYINNVFKSEFENSFGIKLEVGHSLLDALPEPIRALWKSRYDRAFANERFVFEDRVQVMHDTFVYIEVAMNPIIIDNKVIGASFFGSNITERKNHEQEFKRAKEAAEKSEEQLRLISDNFVNGMIYQVFTLDDERRKFTYLSEAVIKLYGCTVEEAMADPNLIYGKIHKEDVSGLIMEEQKAMKDMSVFRTEVRIINVDGSIRWSYFISKPRLVDGNICWDGLEVDITERKQQELELKNAKDKAEESDKLKTEFINNLSHEIRTPMNGILGFSAFLDNPDLDHERRIQYVSIIQNSGNQLMRIIDDILEISRLETKQVKPYMQEVCLNDLLFELFSIFDIRAKQNNVPLYLKKGLSNEQSIIKTDASKLQKVLSNLIENAFKFTNNGFVEFGYLLKNNELEIYVKDTGIGIDTTKHDTIFKRFSQAEKKLSRSVGGLGLGLSIAKENTELLGGKISVVSVIDVGTTFFVHMPYCPVNKIENANLNSHIDALNNISILIAEDEEVNFLYIETLLNDITKNKYKIIHAKNGKEAVGLCKSNNSIGLVLMDIKMPVVDGFKATKQIKSFKPNLPIIAVTAHVSPEVEQQVLKVGCNAYLAKPINVVEFENFINEYLLVK